MSQRRVERCQTDRVSVDDRKPARVEDVHDLAMDMPFVTVAKGPSDNPVYQVGQKKSQLTFAGDVIWFF